MFSALLIIIHCFLLILDFFIHYSVLLYRQCLYHLCFLDAPMSIILRYGLKSLYSFVYLYRCLIFLKKVTQPGTTLSLNRNFLEISIKHQWIFKNISSEKTFWKCCLYLLHGKWSPVIWILGKKNNYFPPELRGWLKYIYF